MRNVPATWYGGEIPDPLLFYRGDRKNVGPVLHIDALRGTATVRVRTTSGQTLPLLVPPPVFEAPRGRGRHTQRAVTVTSGDGLQSFFVARRLTPGARYRVVISDDGRTNSFSFTVAR